MAFFVLYNPFIAGSGLFGFPPVVGPAIGLVVIYLITKAIRHNKGDTKDSERYNKQLDAREQRIKERERMEQLRARERELDEREKRLK
jgi:hypothetical protein